MLGQCDTKGMVCDCVIFVSCGNWRQHSLMLLFDSMSVFTVLKIVHLSVLACVMRVFHWVSARHMRFMRDAHPTMAWWCRRCSEGTPRTRRA